MRARRTRSTVAAMLHRLQARWPRVFAALYDPVLALGELTGMRRRRRRLLAAAHGRVVELGAGTGLNLRHYPDGLDELLLVEPDPAMRRRLARRVRRSRARGRRSSTRPAERLPFDDHSVDTVVATLVLCTVEDPRLALREITRVLRPGRQAAVPRTRPRADAAPRPLAATPQRAVAALRVRLPLRPRDGGADARLRLRARRAGRSGRGGRCRRSSGRSRSATLDPRLEGDDRPRGAGRVRGRDARAGRVGVRCGGGGGGTGREGAGCVRRGHAEGDQRECGRDQELGGGDGRFLCRVRWTPRSVLETRRAGAWVSTTIAGARPPGLCRPAPVSEAVRERGDPAACLAQPVLGSLLKMSRTRCSPKSSAPQPCIGVTATFSSASRRGGEVGSGRGRWPWCRAGSTSRPRPRSPISRGEASVASSSAACPRAYFSRPRPASAAGR